jgi:hypothetical protein
VVVMTLAEFLRQTHQRPLPAEALDDLKKAEVRGGLCDGDQGWDGSGILPNGERCDLCEKSRRDDETARDAR